MFLEVLVLNEIKILIYLKDPDLVHEIHDFIRGVVEAGGCQERCDMKWHMRLGGIENKEFGPAMLQHIHLNAMIEKIQGKN